MRRLASIALQVGVNEMLNNGPLPSQQKDETTSAKEVRPKSKQDILLEKTGRKSVEPKTSAPKVINQPNQQLFAAMQAKGRDSY